VSPSNLTQEYTVDILIAESALTSIPEGAMYAGRPGISGSTHWLLLVLVRFCSAAFILFDKLIS
jgi:hypothetical protein